ncbi:hypothetical protein HanPI659440_Chr10g0393951 [Helianthus annuus]|nr:hypothetical protein HanPI659440_Chr10g0393951 [Helianthus annuus]
MNSNHNLFAAHIEFRKDGLICQEGKLEAGVHLLGKSYGIKVGYGGIPGPSNGRDASASQAGEISSDQRIVGRHNVVVSTGDGSGD